MSFSKIIKKVSLAGAFGMLGLMGSDSAQAVGVFDSQQSFDVTATVVGSCTMDAALTVLDMGTWTFAGGGASAPTSMLVNCSSGTAWQLVFGTGLNGARNMLGVPSGDLLDYELYYGTTNATVAGTHTGVGIAADQTIDLYAESAAGQANIGTGAYSDTVTVDLWF